jgi:hypothetical protein
MDRTIYFTYNDFENNYKNELQTFLDEWEDNSKLDFLEIQKHLYLECIDNTTITNNLWELRYCYIEPKSGSLKKIQDIIGEYVYFERENSIDLGYRERFRLRIKDIDLCNKYNRSFNKILNFINDKIENKITEAAPEVNNKIQNDNNLSDKIDFSSELIKNKKFDPNYFNEKGFELFLYYIDNYTVKDGKKIKFVNIFFVLKEFFETSKNQYRFNFNQNQYKIYIEINYHEKITKFSTAQYDFIYQKQILIALEVDFRSQNQNNE